MKRYTALLNAASTAGLIAFAYFLVLYALMGKEFVLIDFSEPMLRESMTVRVHPFAGIRMLGVVIPILFMWRAVNRFKQEEGEGFITFMSAFRIGVLFTFVYSTLSAMLIFLFGSGIDASFVEYANQVDLRLLQLLKEADQDIFGSIDTQIELIKQRDLTDFALSDAWGKTSGGFIIALIIAVIVKQKPPTFATNE